MASLAEGDIVTARVERIDPARPGTIDDLVMRLSDGTEVRMWVADVYGLHSRARVARMNAVVGTSIQVAVQDLRGRTPRMTEFYGASRPPA